MIPNRKWLGISCGVSVLAVLAAIEFMPVRRTATGPPVTAQLERPQSPPQPAAQSIREPAVAGLFYPKEEKRLASIIDELIDRADPYPIADLKGLICPHAGYDYSGPTAASAYRTLAGRDIQTVIVMAPSHYALFSGISIARSDAYRTPLGLIDVAPWAKELAQSKPFVWEPVCPVQRPPWWPQSPKTAPLTGKDTPDTWEHAAEVQLPFLQRVLSNFKIVTAVFGDADPEAAARILANRIDDHTLMIASSDLSHYHPYDEAKALDARCVNAICNLDFELMRSQEACGSGPILTLMHLAQLKGWKARLLDSRNSGDTSGDKSRVVGYAAIAFYLPEPALFTDQERSFLLDLARQSIKQTVANASLPTPDAAALAPKFTQPKGCFVTLTRQGDLRGCIGHIEPQMPLYQAVIENARASAIHDPRFLPVQSNELNQIEIEISVLTVPKPLAFGSAEDLVKKLQPYKDGVVLKLGSTGATFLPQVWAQIPNKTNFLDSLAL
ncbi:MAG: AmmeMemoRadiSam system protein B [Candidatus Omnitrophica bacterium]|nr:AmmeMemoRadiSam system protein B [Candidatus Omnitrophota bacterium]